MNSTIGTLRRALLGFTLLAAACLIEQPALAAATDGLSAEQRTRADRLISLFENDTLDIQYGYVVDNDDGRGYTAGRGLTTGTGDVLEAVRLYTARVPDNRLARFLSRLQELTDQESASTSGLDGFPAEWAAAAADPVFRAVQDRVNDRNSYQPAMQLAEQLGVRTALGKVMLYDATFMHGLGDDPDGTPALVDRTRARVGGLPATGVDERTWLNAFLAVRRDDLLHAYNVATRKEWARAVGRVDILGAIAVSGNYQFSGPLVVSGGDHEATIP